MFISAAGPERNGRLLMEPKALAGLAVASLDKHKAEDIKVIGVTELTSIADYFVIASGTSTTQVSLLPNVSSMAAVSAPRRVLVPNIWAAP